MYGNKSKIHQDRSEYRLYDSDHCRCNSCLFQMVQPELISDIKGNEPERYIAQERNALKVLK